MKTKITTIVMAMLMSITAIVFNGCKGKDGDPGAQGPAGAQGNANVSYMTFTTTSANWSYAYPYESTSFNDLQITSDIINTGSVFVYVTASTGETTLLPWTYYQTVSLSRTWRCQPGVGNISVMLSESDLNDPGNPGALTFKVVVIASHHLIENPNVDFQNYESVKRAFNLKD